MKTTRSRLFLSFAFLCMMAMSAIMVVSASPKSAPTDVSTCLNIMLPLYIYPNHWDTANYIWDDIAAANAQVPTVAIVNPNSGPVSPPNADYVQGMTDLADGSVKMIGYVATDYANRDIDVVKAEIDIYADEYSVWLTGIFFDEGSSSAADIDYYTEIYDYVHAIAGFDMVVTNPGTPPDELYLSTPATDVSVTFESFGSNWMAYTPPSYVWSYQPERFAMLAHTTASSADMETYLDRAGFRNSQYVYITDQAFATDPWDDLATYYSAEIAKIVAMNADCESVPLAVNISEASTSNGEPERFMRIAVAAWGMLVLISLLGWSRRVREFG